VIRKYAVACICIIASLMFFSTSTFADLVLAKGEATGQWYNPERSGEGFYVEIINTGGNQQIGVAMFTFDDNGDPLWVSGNVAIGPNDEVVSIPVFRFDGPMWGPDFDSDDLNQTRFGTITARFPDCDSALFQMATEGGVPQGGSYALIRLTDIEGIECNNPPPDQSFPAGKWDGDGVCLNVAEDGNSITGVGSGCANGTAFWSNLNGVSEDTGDCNVELACAGEWPIEDGGFACVNSEGDLVIGEFSSSNSASGLAFKERGGNNDYCVAAWSASPAN
jgi:hypothetical protein